MRSDAEGPSPWYRHFWPWFIVLLMAVSIAASLSTVVIAFRLGPLEIPEAEPLSSLRPPSPLRPPAASPLRRPAPPRGAAPKAPWPERFGGP